MDKERWHFRQKKQISQWHRVKGICTERRANDLVRPDPRFQGEVSEYITRKGVGDTRRRLFYELRRSLDFRYGQCNDFVLILLSFDPISHFKACNSLFFSTVYYHSYNLSLELFCQPQRKSYIHESVTSPFFPPIFLSLWLILDISYSWNHMILCLLCLISFTEPSIFMVHPCCGMYQYIIPF